MTIEHVIQQGESVVGLSERYGFFARTIWDHPRNAELKKKRKDMNVLMPGDVVFIPDLVEKQVAAATGRRHRFRRKGVPAVFRLQVFDFETPRASQDYTFTVDGRAVEGKTDDRGVLEEYVPPNARAAELVIGPDRHTVSLRFGFLDPMDEPSGVKKRLSNLGYDPGASDGPIDDRARAALRAFQRRFKLPVTGEPDDATLKKLEEMHDTRSAFPDDEHGRR
jgi:N-acetylmuramoyl-L-alanine amidase